MSRFESIKKTFQEQIISSFTSGSVEKIENAYNSFPVSNSEKRVILDQILRDTILKLTLERENDLKSLEAFVNYSIQLSRSEICSPSVPVVLLSDIFEIFTLDQCENLFTFVENGVTVWKEDLFFGACKNNLLRMCNDLLRRLSRSQNTVFRGRILLFLAKFFPFSERSGLNIVSEFSLDNVGEYSSDNARIENFETNDDVESESKFKIDYNFYNKFLTLQEFLRSPNQCYNKVSWRVFVNIFELNKIEAKDMVAVLLEKMCFKTPHALTILRCLLKSTSATDILSAFQNFKLDGEQFQNKPAEEHISEATNSTFFAKYMTNPKLLELQLTDPDFRRSILIQFLIILQYLSSPVKFKLDIYELKPEQSDWTKEQISLVYDLLAETPANSANFAAAVKHILNREQLWNNWKNEGCPEFKKPTFMEEKDEAKPSREAKKRNIGELIKYASNHKKYYMGHPELTRLWNLNPNNLEACKVKERNFLPELDDYFKEAIMQMDPAAEIELKYRKVNDPNFGWRALRLLMQRSSCFFTSTNNPITKLPDYLELSLKRIIKDRPQNANSEETKQEVLNTEAEEVEELLKQDDKEAQEETGEEKVTEPRIAPYLLEEVAKHVGGEWRKVAVKIGFDNAEELDVIEKEKQTDVERAEKMLKIWAEVDVDASPENLAYTLEGLNLMNAANVLKPKSE